MKLRNAFAVFVDLRFAVQAALFPTLLTITRSPRLLLQWTELSRVFMSHVWATFGNSVDEGGRETKQSLLPNNARGIVLDIGAGESTEMLS